MLQLAHSFGDCVLGYEAINVPVVEGVENNTISFYDSYCLLLKIDVELPIHKL